mmetsp:Transcript_32459/g.82699  ORF Transcript_32459/g.82699 Transcript_32459/m.82699 type:complete len:242 (+) Transcript_32459:123-848(+)
MSGSSAGRGAGAAAAGAAAAGVGTLAAPWASMYADLSRANSSKTFCTSVSIWVSSSEASKPSSIISSVISARAISLRISSMVFCSSGMFIKRFISFITAPDIFRADAVDIDAMDVVRCRLTACMEHFVRSNLTTDVLDRTTCFARVRTLCTCPLLAMAVISFFSFTSSWRMRLMSRSRRRCSLLICLCHSRALSLTVSSWGTLFPICPRSQRAYTSQSGWRQRRWTDRGAPTAHKRLLVCA